MWPFSSKRVAQEKEFIRSAFARYLQPELLEKLTEDPNGLLAPPLERAAIGFALLQVRDDDLAGLPARMGRAVEVAGAGGGMMDIMAPFVLITFGYPRNLAVADLRLQRKESVAMLLRDFGHEIRIVSGETEALCGPLGSAQRFYWGTAIPALSRAMQKLMTLEFGAAAEMQMA